MEGNENEIRGELLYEWTPTPQEIGSDEDRWKNDIADSYRIMAIPAAASGIIVYANYRGRWEANVGTMRPLIKHLLSRICK